MTDLRDIYEPSSHPGLSRRRMLQLLLGSAGATLLAACGSQASAPAGSGQASAPSASQRAAAAAKSSSSPVPDTTTLFTGKPKLATLEEELALPESVLQAATKEGKLALIASWTNNAALQKFFDAFKKRYPGIDIQYQTAEEQVRTVRTLTEFKAGRAAADVVDSIAGAITQFQSAGALLALNDLPAYSNYDEPLVDESHQWASYQVNIWGVAYNTSSVKPADVPKTWDDLTLPKWKGRIGLANRPQLWAQTLWKEWGAERTTDFLKKLFANNPQRRNEGLDAIISLVGAGEMDLCVPAQTHRVEGLVQQKVPVGWTVMEPFNVAPGDIEIVKGPNQNAAKVFMNWMLSREGSD